MQTVAGGCKLRNAAIRFIALSFLVMSPRAFCAASVDFIAKFTGVNCCTPVWMAPYYPGTPDCAAGYGQANSWCIGDLAVGCDNFPCIKVEKDTIGESVFCGLPIYFRVQVGGGDYFMPASQQILEVSCGPDDKKDGPPPCPTGCSTCAGKGMPVWSVSEPFINLWLRDEPLGYQPALGPRISFELDFKQREQTAGFDTNIFSIGKNWNFAWFSYVMQDAIGSNAVHLPDGREVSFYSANEYLTEANLTGDTNSGFTLLHPDGSKEVYGFIVTNSTGAFLKAFMTEQWNPQGQKTSFTYSSYTPAASPVIRLQTVIDGDGRTNFVYYNTSNAYGTNLIISVVDPFGRSNSLAYDSSGRLTNSTDIAGLPTSFSYDGNGWVTNMTTPYGLTGFTFSDTAVGDTAPNGRSVLVTLPDGGHELFLYTNNAPGIASSYPTNQVPNTGVFNNTFETNNLDVRNSFHWGTRQYSQLSTMTITSFNTNDFRLARMRHWLVGFNYPAWLGQTLVLERDPSPDLGGTIEGQKTWYDHAGKASPSTEGTQSLPLFIASVLPDGTTSFTRTDRNSFGNVLTNVSTYTVSGGTALRTNIFTYDGTFGIDLLTTTNALGIQTASNVYNGYHQVLTNWDALGQMTTYAYNGNQQLVSMALPSGLVITNVYGADNWTASNYSYATVGGTMIFYGTNIYTYANDLVLAHIDPRGLAVTNTWDNLQRLVRQDYPDGTYITNTYNSLDLIRIVDRLGLTNLFAYDAMRRKIRETNAAGVVTAYEYCNCGSLTAITNAVGTTVQAVTRLYYDNQSRLSNVLYPDGYAVTNNYNILGQMTNLADSAGVSLTNWFNNQGLLYATSNFYGQVSKLSFDVLDRVTNTVDANGVSLVNTYDNLDRALSRSFPDGGVEHYGYTIGVAKPTCYTNQLLKTTLYTFDPRAFETAETNANLEVTRFTNDAAGDLVALVDGKGQNTFWHYDLYGLVTNKVDNTGTELLRYAYDADQRLTNRWSAAKGNTGYSHDRAGNLMNVAYPTSHAISFAYDSLNRLTNMIDAAGTNHLIWDSGGLLVSEGGLWDSDTVTYTNVNRLRTTLSVLQPGTTAWSQTYAYDPARRLTNTTSPAGSFVYAYDTTRNLLVRKLSLPNASFITNDYDSTARLLDTVLKNSGGTVLNSHSYGYNAGNQRTNQTFAAGNYVSYLYDDIGQLTNAQGKEAGGASRLQERLGCAFDAAHNLTSRTNNALHETFSVNSLNELSSISRNASNALTVAGATSSQASSVTVNGLTATLYDDKTFAKDGFSVVDGDNTFTAVANDSVGRTANHSVTVTLSAANAYIYDANGNLLSDGKRGFEYDDENELISVTVTNSWRTEFVYDGKMRLRKRKEFSWISGAWVATTAETRYVYDGNVVIQERDNANNAAVAYTRGNDISGSFQGEGGIGGLLARSQLVVAYSPIPAQHAFYHCDGSGNITAIANPAQYIVARYEYDPFGNITAQSGPLAETNTYRFSSKEFHAKSGLVYYLCRFYDPSLQRWLTKDPAQEIGGLNLYGFCGNDPVLYEDESGMFWGQKFLGWLAKSRVLDFVVGTAATETALHIVEAHMKSCGSKPCAPCKACCGAMFATGQAALHASLLMDAIELAEVPVPWIAAIRAATMVGIFAWDEIELGRSFQECLEACDKKCVPCKL